jgi:hypothetical protein
MSISVRLDLYGFGLWVGWARVVAAAVINMTEVFIIFMMDYL